MFLFSTVLVVRCVCGTGSGMSMTPKRTEPDEDSYYDLLIEQELERINLEDEDLSEDGEVVEEAEEELPQEEVCF